MAKYPVTQKLYQEVMEQSPSYFKGESLPVEQVSWFDAVRFCNKLSERVGLQPCYRIEEAEAQPEVEWDQSANGYRLPTEAEWEYACRAATETAYSFGDDAAQLHEYAWFDGISEGRAHEVGHKKPNGWGLHDLHGNVWEWCWDWYGDYQVSNDLTVSQANTIGPPTGNGRVLRGGSFARRARVPALCGPELERARVPVPERGVSVCARFRAPALILVCCLVVLGLGSPSESGLCVARSASYLEVRHCFHGVKGCSPGGEGLLTWR